MVYTVELVETQTVITAVASDTVELGKIGDRIMPLFDRVYSFLNGAGIKHLGVNVILYLNGRIDLEAGVEVSESFSGSGGVYCSNLPAGRAAHSIHFGPYNQLYEAHQAVQTWCREREWPMTGVSWEVYGHWQEDPSSLRTDVYYLLEEPV